MTEKAKPQILEPTDAIVRVTLGSICSSDLHIKHGGVPGAVPGITVGHEMVGGWALGCRIDGGQDEYVRVPLA